jgi:hypothetical protein
MTERRQELFFQHIGRIPVFSLLTWYMMKRSVFAYFRFQRLTRLRALLILGGIVLVVGMLLGLPVLVALSRGTRLI